MEFISNYWYLIICAIAAIAVVVYALIKFFKKPGSEQLAKVKEWLLFAVAEAERALGGGTGQLKLRYVYDMFVSKFSYIAKFVSFETFSNMVDEVLVKFRKMLEENNAVKQYVGEQDG